MALETLKNITHFNKFKVINMDRLKLEYPEKFNPESSQMDYKWFEKEIRPNNFIYVRGDVNSIAFTIQKGPIKENGVNGCQVDEIVVAAKTIIEGLNDLYPCRENFMAITKLDEALMWLNERKKDRTARGVEGSNKS